MNSLRYGSGSVFRVAVDAYQSVPTSLRPREWIREGHAPLVALGFSSMGFEAFVNEAVACLEDPLAANSALLRKRFEKKLKTFRQQRDLRPDGMPEPAWTASCLRFAQVGRHYEAGEPAFADLCRLFELRRWLLHQPPSQIGRPGAESRPAEIAALEPLGILVDIRVGQIMEQTIHISTRAAMRWMCNAASRMVRQMQVDILEASAYYRTDGAQSEHWPTL